MSKILNKKVGLLTLLVLVAIVSSLVTSNLSINIEKSQNSGVTVSIGMANIAYAAETPDYYCDGVDDQIQFSLAASALPSNGGEIKLLAGNYSFSSQWANARDNITINGTGKGSYISLDGSTAVISTGSQTGWVLNNFSTDAGGVDISSGTSCSIKGIWVNGTFMVDLSPPERWVRSYTYIVAASDSDSHEKAQADYVCTGSSDETVINNAITAAGTGGSIKLLKGTYVIDGNILLNQNYFTFEGSGNGTVIEILDGVGSAVSALYVTGDFPNISHFMINGNYSSANSGYDFVGVDITNAELTFVCNLYISDVVTGISYQNTGGTVEECLVWSGDIGAYIGNGAESVTVSNSIFVEHVSANIVIESGSFLNIIGNSILGSEYGVVIDDSSYMVDITGNLFSEHSYTIFSEGYFTTASSNHIYTTGDAFTDAGVNGVYRGNTVQDFTTLISDTGTSTICLDNSTDYATSQTIAGGVVTLLNNFHRLDGQGGVADDLDTVNGCLAGTVITISIVDDTITVKDGTGNIQCNGDFAMDSTLDTFTMMFDGTNWLEISRSNNA